MRKTNEILYSLSIDSLIYKRLLLTLFSKYCISLIFSIASLSVHVFVGEQKINDSNIDLFMQSSKIIFIVFTVLCVIGVFSSLVRKRGEN